MGDEGPGLNKIDDKVKNPENFTTKSNQNGGFDDSDICDNKAQTFPLSDFSKISEEKAQHLNKIGIKDEGGSSRSGRENVEFINRGDEDEMEIVGYELCMTQNILTWIFIVLSAGLLRIVFHWWPHLFLFSTHTPCPVSRAQKILVTEYYQEKYKRYYVKPVFILTSDLFKSQSSLRIDKEISKLRGCPNLVIPASDGTFTETSQIRTFSCKKVRYIWSDDLNGFYKLNGFENVVTSELHSRQGLSPLQQLQRRLIYGSNEIRVEIQSIIKLLFLEVLNPFYIFQIFSVSLWLSDNYIYFASAIIIMSIFGIASTIIQTRQNQKKLKTTVQSSDITMVSRGGGVFESISTELLVPGDVMVIPPHGATMHCDAALLSGSCIVNESMLTGESVPVSKSALPNRSDVIYDSKEHSRHTLFCGTHVIQTRYYGNEKVCAVVLRTGFMTAKGHLVRSIMYPPPVDYKFEKDSYKFVAVLACIAGIGFIYSVLVKVAYGESVRNILVDSLDLFTIVVPPALPAAMTVGRFYAQRRLQKQGVYCISPRAINVSGSINCVCFDKTGTLTEEGLDLWAIVPTFENEIQNSVEFRSPIREGVELENGSHFSIGMAACHSLTRINQELIGDPLDLKMFEWIGWSLDEPGVNDTEKFDMIAPTVVRPPSLEPNENEMSKVSGVDVGIVRQFPFSSSLQRMSVITRTLGDSEYELYSKGSPEIISSLSLPSTIPKNFRATLESYTQEGYRVIALGHKRLSKLNYAKVQRVVRDEIETELSFLGLIIMENRLKPQTSGVIQVLKNANIRTIMVTGDNLLTAVSVAKECEMIDLNEKVIVLSAHEEKDKTPTVEYTFANHMNPKEMKIEDKSAAYISKNLLKSIENGVGAGNRYHFALSGPVFDIIRTYHSELLSRILVRGTVFARMSPEQKQQLVELLQSLGYFVGMCGDGSNDCGALKAAHGGISLSDTESSVAAPFTSREPDIRCVPNLIREGRGALVTSFGIFKYMAIYSLTQFISVIILYTISSNLTDLQFLYIDLFLISVFAFFFGNAKPLDGPLFKQPPSASLVSIPPIASILSHISAIIGVQVLSYLYVQKQSWFKPYEPKEDDFGCFENYTIFSVSAFQYIVMAVVFSSGPPYRKSIVHNPGLLISLLLMTSFTIYLVLYPTDFLRTTLELVLPDDYGYRLTLIGIGAAQFLIALFIENFIVDYLLSQKLRSKFYNLKESKKEYERIEWELSTIPHWPPVSSSSSTASVYVVANEKNSAQPRMVSNTSRGSGSKEGLMENSTQPRAVFSNGDISVTKESLMENGTQPPMVCNTSGSNEGLMENSTQPRNIYSGNNTSGSKEGLMENSMDCSSSGSKEGLMENGTEPRMVCGSGRSSGAMEGLMENNKGRIIEGGDVNLSIASVYLEANEKNTDRTTKPRMVCNNSGSGLKESLMENNIGYGNEGGDSDYAKNNGTYSSENSLGGEIVTNSVNISRPRPRSRNSSHSSSFGQNDENNGVKKSNEFNPDSASYS